MRLLLAKTFLIYRFLFEKKRIKKKVWCAICGDYEREKKERERKRAGERDPGFFRVVCVSFGSASSSKKRDKTTRERINIII